MSEAATETPAAPSHCIDCKTLLVHRRITEGRVVADVTYDVEMPVLWCEACGDYYVTHQVLEQSELSIARDLAVSGQRTREGFLYMRKAMGLSRSQLGTILGMTVESIYRWETMTLPEARGFVLLGQLILDRIEGRETTRELLDAALGRGRETPPSVRRVSVAE